MHTYASMGGICLLLYFRGSTKEKSSLILTGLLSLRSKVDSLS